MRIRRSAPFTGWYAVVALAVIAALGASTVVGAGLSLWRGSSSQRVLGVAQEPILRPGSGVVTVPAQPAAKPRKSHTSTPATPAVAVPVVRQRHVAVVVKPAVRPSAPVPVRHTPVAKLVTRPLRTLPGLHVGRPVGQPVQAHVFALGDRSAMSVLVIFGHPARVGVHLVVAAASSVLPQLPIVNERADLEKPKHDKPDSVKPEHVKPEHVKPEHVKPEHVKADSDSD